MLGSLIVAGIAGLCAVGSLADAKVRDCDMLLPFLGLDFVLAIMHIVFAFYLQRRLISGLNATAEGQGQGQAPQALSAKELMNRAGHIFMYDVGFCLYTVGFVIAFCWNCVGMGWIGDCKDASSLAYVAAVLMILYALFTVNFAILWYCALCCDDCCSPILGSSKPVNTGQAQQNKGLMRMVMGKSAFIPGGGQAAVYGQPVAGTPVQAQPVPQQAQPVPQQAQPAAAPQQQGMVGMGLGMLGGGLQMAGKALQGQGKK